MNDTAITIEWQERSCPMCQKTEVARVVLESNYDPAKMTPHAFASRKLPEYMHSRMVKCADCGLVYGTPAVSIKTMQDAYATAAFDSSQESGFAADTYSKLIESQIRSLSEREAALDIGTGDGAFLQRLLRLKFRNVVGVEPSAAPIAAASSEIRPLIRHGIFRAEDFEPGRFDLITCFQVLEHVPDPVGLVRDCRSLLKRGGMFVAAVHNIYAVSARVLGDKSPIFDIEHLQLFSAKTVVDLLHRSGFDRSIAHSIWNRYPLSYWLRLFPLPPKMKEVALGAAAKSHLGAILVPFPAGNIAAFGWKPSENDHVHV